MFTCTLVWEDFFRITLRRLRSQLLLRSKEIPLIGATKRRNAKAAQERKLGKFRDENEPKTDKSGIR